jgi:hypothetical protein
MMDTFFWQILALQKLRIKRQRTLTLFAELQNICVRKTVNKIIAPEMIVGSGHDHTLDWWALGILLYEMIIGIPPFYNKNKH